MNEGPKYQIHNIKYINLADFHISGKVKHIKSEKIIVDNKYNPITKSDDYIEVNTINEYNFTESGNLFKRIETKTVIDKNITNTYTNFFSYEYNEHNKISKYIKKGSSSFLDFIYDEDNRLKEILDRSSSGRIGLNFSFEYDNKGNIISEKRDDSKYCSNNDSIYFFYINRLSYLQNKLIKVVTFAKNGSINSYEEFDYDNKNRIVKKTEKGIYSEKKITTFNYNENNDIIRKNTNQLFEYEYDSHGNWIKMIEYDEFSIFGFKRKKPVSITNREIAYY